MRAWTESLWNIHEFPQSVTPYYSLKEFHGFKPPKSTASHHHSLGSPARVDRERPSIPKPSMWLWRPPRWSVTNKSFLYSADHHISWQVQGLAICAKFWPILPIFMGTSFIFCTHSGPVKEANWLQNSAWWARPSSLGSHTTDLQGDIFCVISGLCISTRFIRQRREESFARILFVLGPTVSLKGVLEILVFLEDQLNGTFDLSRTYDMVVRATGQLGFEPRFESHKYVVLLLPVLVLVIIHHFGIVFIYDHR